MAAVLGEIRGRLPRLREVLSLSEWDAFTATAGPGKGRAQAVAKPPAQAAAEPARPAWYRRLSANWPA